MRRRSTLTIALAGVTALMLASCTPPGGEEPEETKKPVADDSASGGGVGFDELQSATVQIEAVGTFVDPAVGAYEGAGRGSGLILDESGLVLTNNHVVTGAGTLKVWVGEGGGDALNAEVLGVSECLDLAVIDLEGDGYPFYEWYEGDITNGLDVYSAGFPLGDPEFTLTRGIVSKSDTALESAWASPGSVIEHDARIRGGNSGGPLVDAEGRVVGVNYAGEDVNDQNFAIHRDAVLEVLEDLKAGTNVTSMGVNGQAVSSEDGSLTGIWVNSVQSGSAADAAGVEPGDMITQMEGVTLGLDGTMADYCDVIRTHGNDGVISMEVLRYEEGAYYQGQFNGDPLEVISVAPAAGEAGETTEGTAYSAYEFITDDSGTIEVEVPVEWAHRDGASYVDSFGNNVWDIRASTDLQAFQDTWDVPGVTVSASVDGLANGSLTLDGLYATMTSGADEMCTRGSTTDYSDGFHTGYYELMTDCGGGAADYLVLVANADDGSYVVWVTGQAVSDADYEALDRVLGSFIASVV